MSDAVGVQNGLQASPEITRLQQGPQSTTTDTTRHQRGLQGAPWITKDSVNASRRSGGSGVGGSISGGSILQASTSISQSEEIDGGKGETGRRPPSPAHTQSSSCDSDNDSTHRSHVSAKGEEK